MRNEAKALEPSPAGGRGQGDGVNYKIGEAPYSTRKAELLEYARELRQNSTDVERIMWKILRNRQVLNFKFRRQQSVGKYIADFLCTEQKIIIELDGGQHNEERNKIYDLERTKFLEQQGYKVLRFWNIDVLKNLEGVVESIFLSLKHPHPNPLPLAGRGLTRRFHKL